MEAVRIASVFSGCGGMDLGARGGFTFLNKRYARNNTRLVFANDIDSSASDIFDANFACKMRREDIRKIPSKSIPNHDLLIGGFPCQSFSIVAQNPPRLGRNSETGKLFYEMVRIIRDKQPKSFIAENVKGLLSVDRGETFRLILKEFRDVGYNIEFRLLNSATFGVPQRRERVFIIGIRSDLKTFPIFPILKKRPVPLSAVLTAEKLVPSRYYFSQRAVKGMQKSARKMNKGRIQNLKLPSATLTAHLAKVSINSTDPVLLVKRRYRRFTPREAARIQSFPETFKLIGSDGKQYKALGNAVPPVVMWYVTREVLKTINKYS